MFLWAVCLVCSSSADFFPFPSFVISFFLFLSSLPPSFAHPSFFFFFFFSSFFSYFISCRPAGSPPILMAFPRPATAKYAYAARAQNELALEPGLRLLLLDAVSEDWYTASTGSGAKGLVPRAYVSDDAPAVAPTPAPTPAAAIPAAIPAPEPALVLSVRAVHPYSGRSPEELTFARDDVLVVLGVINEDWFSASAASGQRGRIPKAFVEPLTKVEQRTKEAEGEPQRQQPAPAPAPASAPAPTEPATPARPPVPEPFATTPGMPPAVHERTHRASKKKKKK